MFKKINAFAIEETRTYQEADNDGRVFSRERAAVQFLNMFAGYKAYAIVDYNLNEFGENEQYVKEYIVLPKHIKLPANSIECCMWA